MQSCSHGSGRWTGKDFPTICSRKIFQFSGRFPSMFSAHPCLAHQSVCLRHLRAQQRKSQWFLVRLKLFHGKCRGKLLPQPGLQCRTEQFQRAGPCLWSQGGPAGCNAAVRQPAAVPCCSLTPLYKHHPSPPRAAALSASWGC